jgi:hypothetical protein
MILLAMYKVFRKGNYIFIHTPEGKELEGFASVVLITRDTPETTVYYFKGLNGSINQDNSINLEDIVNEAGEAYQDFDQWRCENSGHPYQFKIS